MAGKDRGRQAGFRMDDSHRLKIANSNILNVLVEHAEGKRELSASQVTAGIALMKKILPDLASVDLNASLSGQLQIVIGDRDADL